MAKPYDDPEYGTYYCKKHKISIRFLKSINQQHYCWDCLRDEDMKPTLADLKNPLPLPCPVCERPNMNPSDHHMVPRSRGGKSTETICRDCHKAIHSVFSNKELEATYHTVDALMSHEQFAKMVAFIAKQDPGGKLNIKHTNERDKKR